MATNFKGYLLKFGNIVFPNEYLAMDKCTSTPNTRVEIEAYRDDYAYYPVVSDNTVSGSESYAGVFGKPVDKFMAWLE